MPRHLERLTTRIIHPHDPTPSDEDIFSSALEILFTDDTQQSHGVPGQSIIYRSPRFGDVFLQIPVHPDEDGGRRLFAHHLWNAGVFAAEGIEKGSCDDNIDGGDEGNVSDGEDGEDDVEVVQWDKRFWDMRGKNVLELGAATALPSLIATLSNAQSVTSTDHPSSPAITSNTISSNFQINITNRKIHVDASTTSAPKSSTAELSQQQQQQQEDGQGEEPEYSVNTPTSTPIPPKLHQLPAETNTHVQIYGYTWGTTTFHPVNKSPNFLSSITPTLNSFDRIVIADCLWMADQHVNLIKTILLYLGNSGSAPPANTEQENLEIEGTGSGEQKQRQGPPENGEDHPACAIVVAGFHTGRTVVRDFIDLATTTTTTTTTGSVHGREVDDKDEGERACREHIQDDHEEERGGQAINTTEIQETKEIRGKLVAAQIFEVDVHGQRRDWDPMRPGESKQESKKWCMCAILTRR